ncbi:DUF6790 family protein [Methylocella sp.]|uniref:DUF6790 family protein n=1 Tax=Methylocella sp. TaxID=1978226 RepID=UPI0035B1E5F2
MSPPSLSSLLPLVFENVGPILFALAFVAAALDRGKPVADRLLSWLLLLPIGLGGLWSAYFHLFQPALAANAIGWADSPFQFEVGMADLALGIAGCFSVYASFGFRAAVTLINAIFLAGDGVGHARQMIVARNFAVDNAGPAFWVDLALPLVSLACLHLSRKSRK